MKIEDLAKSQELGDFIHLYSFRPIGLCALFIFSLISIPIALFMTLMGLSLVIGDLNPNLFARLFGLILAVLGIFAVGCLPYMLIKSFILAKKRGLYSYELGLIDPRGFRTDIIRYAEIKNFWIKIVDHYNKNGRYKGTEYVYTIRTRKGKKFIFDNTFKDVKQLGDFLIQEVLKYKFSEILQLYSSGEVIKFGKISLHSTYLQFGRKNISWNDIKKISAQKGYLYISQKDKWFELKIKICDIPNFPLLVALLNQVRHLGIVY